MPDFPRCGHKVSQMPHDQSLSMSHDTGFDTSRQLQISYETLRFSAIRLLAQNWATFVWSDITLWMFWYGDGSFEHLRFACQRKNGVISERWYGLTKCIGKIYYSISVQQSNFNDGSLLFWLRLYCQAGVNGMDCVPVGICNEHKMPLIWLQTTWVPVTLGDMNVL